MAKWVMGIDGGGTTTIAKLYREKSTTLMARGEAINLHSNPPRQVMETLSHTAGSLFAQIGGPEHCAYVVVGAAGLSHKQAGTTMKMGLRNAGYQGPLLVVMDMETAFWGALPAGLGAILISGTGSFCYGRDAKDNAWRTGGGGHLIDDEGSAYAIGRDILSRILQEWDGRAAPSQLPALLLECKGILNYQDMMSFVYSESTHKQDIAAIAPLISTGCAAGDGASLEIAKNAGRQLCQLACPLLERLSLQAFSLSMLGSVLRKNPEVRSAAQECLLKKYPRLTIVEPSGDSADGAVLIAQRMLSDPHFRLRSPFQQEFKAEYP